MADPIPRIPLDKMTPAERERWDRYCAIPDKPPEPRNVDKEQAFVRAKMEGKTDLEAYKASHPDSPGNDWAHAKRFKEQPTTRAVMSEAQKERARQTGIDTAWVVEKLVAVVERAMQAEEVFDRRGNPTGEWKFDSGGAIGALALLARHTGGFEKGAGSGEGGKTQVLINVVYENGKQMPQISSPNVPQIVEARPLEVVSGDN